MPLLRLKIALDKFAKPAVNNWLLTRGYSAQSDIWELIKILKRMKPPLAFSLQHLEDGRHAAYHNGSDAFAEEQEMCFEEVERAIRRNLEP